MNKPKPTVIIREVYPTGTRQFMFANDADALDKLRSLRATKRASGYESTFYTGRIEWSEPYQ